jgi:hypothetical protein
LLRAVHKIDSTSLRVAGLEDEDDDEDDENDDEEAVDNLGSAH